MSIRFAYQPELQALNEYAAEVGGKRRNKETGRVCAMTSWKRVLIRSDDDVRYQRLS